MASVDQQFTTARNYSMHICIHLYCKHTNQGQNLVLWLGLSESLQKGHWQISLWVPGGSRIIPSRLVGVMSVAVILKFPSVTNLNEMPCAKNLNTCLNLTVLPERCGFHEKDAKDLGTFV